MASVPLSTGAPDTSTTGLQHTLEGGPEVVVFSDEIRKDLMRLATHIDSRAAQEQEEEQEEEGEEPGFGAGLDDVIGNWQVGTTKIAGGRATELRRWLDSALPFVDEKDATEDARHTRLLEYTRIFEQRGRGPIETQEPATGIRLLQRLLPGPPQPAPPPLGRPSRKQAPRR